MSVDPDRHKILEEASVIIYQQISAGWKIEKIKTGLSRSKFTLEEQRIIFKLGKERYINFHAYLKKTNRDSAFQSICIGVVFLAVIFIIINILGWPEFARYQGRFITAILLGIGAIFYGIWEWFNSEMPDTRNDITID